MSVNQRILADSRSRATRAAPAGYLSFAVLGLAVASWTSRTPQLIQRLALEPSQFALLLSAVALGGTVALPVSGRLVARLGTRRLLLSGTAFVVGALAVIGLSFTWRSTVLLVVGVTVLGAITGIWDVAVAVTIADLERRTGRALMPRAYASFSLGSITGALLGALATPFHVSVATHLGAVAAAVAIGMPLVASRLIPGIGVSNSVPLTRVGRNAWRERRTVTLGLVALTFAVLEGAGSNWIAIAAVRDDGFSAASASVLYVTFLGSATAGRWFAGSLVRRWGRIVIVRVGAVTAIAGITVFAFLDVPFAPFLGSFLWGVGVAAGLPLSNSAAGEGAAVSARVSVVTSLSYLGFLIGPALVGASGAIGTLSTGLVLLALPLLGFAFVFASSLRPQPNLPAVAPAQGVAHI